MCAPLRHNWHCAKFAHLRSISEPINDPLMARSGWSATGPNPVMIRQMAAIRAAHATLARQRLKVSAAPADAAPAAASAAAAPASLLCGWLLPRAMVQLQLRGFFECWTLTKLQSASLLSESNNSWEAVRHANASVDTHTHTISQDAHLCTMPTTTPLSQDICQRDGDVTLLVVGCARSRTEEPQTRGCSVFLDFLSRDYILYILTYYK